MSHTIRTGLRTALSPQELAVHRQERRERTERLVAFRALTVRNGWDRLNADRAAHGQRPITNFGNGGYVAPPRTLAPVVYAPVLPDSRLIDRASISTFEPSEAMADAFVEHARQLFCHRLVEGTDYSVSAEGVHMRSDLWPEIGRRVTAEREQSKARTQRFLRLKVPESATASD